MGNCPPLPCPSPCPDLSFQDICANNNCHGCCIFHCSEPSVPAEVPAWDSPPVQTRQPHPHLVPQEGSATAREIGGVARDAVPAIGYRSWPSPWHTEPGLVATVATEHDTNSRGVAPPPRVPGKGDRPVVPWLAASGLAAAGHDGDRWAPPSLCIEPGSTEARNRGQPARSPRRTESSVLAAADMPLATPPGPGVPRYGGRRAATLPSLSPRAEPGSSATAARDESRGVARNPGQPVQSPWRALSGLAETWGTGCDAGAAARPDTRRLAVPVESSGQDGSMRRDSWSPAPLPASHSRDPWLPSPSLSPSLSAAGWLSPAESRCRLPHASGAQGTT